MNIRLIHQLPPQSNNPRNSEGAFLRTNNGKILFAYSRYCANSCHDHAACDIAMITSTDEGESWSVPRVIVPATHFGVQNVMSVSGVEQRDGSLAFYFLIKENDGSTSIGRAMTQDNGDSFTSERCVMNCPHHYYVVNNDRLVRLSNGTLIAPASYITSEQNRLEQRVPMTATLLFSRNDGASFEKANIDFTTADPVNHRYGLQEPGILEREDGSLYFWMRTNYGCQYESESAGDIHTFTKPRPSIFTSPPSPMQVKRYEGITYAIYNPVPRYNGRIMEPGSWGRTPFVIRKSLDGVEFGELNIIEDDPTRGYCYPAIFQTNDRHFLLAYCRGDNADGNTLCRLGITKVEIDSIS